MNSAFIDELTKIALKKSPVQAFKDNKKKLRGLTTVVGRGLNVLGGVGGGARGVAVGALNLARGNYAKKRHALKAISRGARLGYRQSREFNRLGKLSKKVKKTAPRVGGNQLLGAAILGGGAYSMSGKKSRS